VLVKAIASYGFGVRHGLYLFGILKGATTIPPLYRFDYEAKGNLLL